MQKCDIIGQKELSKMSGKTSTASKNKYNAKTYDDLKIRVKKGEGEIIKYHASAQGKSLNGYINDLIKADMGEADGADE